MTLDEAKTLGWEFETDVEVPSSETTHAFARKYANGELVSMIDTSADEAPLFVLLANIAEAEGRGFLVGYGGDQHADAALVKKLTGETYKPPPLPEPEPVPPTAEQFIEALAGEASKLPPDAPVTAAKLLELIGKAQQPIPS